jgi:hypothetical protein
MGIIIPWSVISTRSPGKQDLYGGLAISRGDCDRVVGVGVFAGDVREGQRLTDDRRIRVNAECLAQLRDQRGGPFVHFKAGNSHRMFHYAKIALKLYNFDPP